MSEFQTLLDDIDALQKAMPKGKPEQDDDENIKASADGDADDDGIKDGDEDINDDDDDHDEPDGDEMMGKSFAVTLSDGTEVEAMDGTELIKALSNDIWTQRAQTEQILSGAVDLIKSLSGQVADLSAKVERLSKASAGRKSVLNVHEKPDILGKSVAPAVSPQSVLAKALKAQREGRLGGHQVAEIETYLNRGAEIPHALAAQLAD
jgi:hypothetical protein